MKTSMRYASLSDILKLARKKARWTNSPMKRKQSQMIEATFEAWGEVHIFEDTTMREHLAESVAKRLGLSPAAALDRLNSIHRITDYDACKPSSKQHVEDQDRY